MDGQVSERESRLMREGGKGAHASGWVDESARNGVSGWMSAQVSV